MRCTSPRTVGFAADGKTIVWSQKQFSKQFSTFQLPCGKCIDCRLDYARQWAIRCVHEAQMYEKNCFITLTYDDAHLASPKLIYRDFQLFMKQLRKLQNEPMGVFVTGEYGEKNKRPHWHAIIFNWRPADAIYSHSNDRGDKCFQSETLTKTWGRGKCEFGDVTFESAGYCARYAAKKLVHGKDGDHDFHPISKKSSKHAIGKKWLEKFWPDVFNYGRLRLANGASSSIPRYYEKWLKENRPEDYLRYVTKVKSEKMAAAAQTTADEKCRIRDSRLLRSQKILADGLFRETELTSEDQRRKITELKFKQLQDNLKL